MAEKQNREIVRNYSQFKDAMDLAKFLDNHIIVLQENKNHTVSMASSKNLIHEKVKDIVLKVSADKQCASRYQFHLRATGICPQPFFRFDAAGGSHKNNCPDMALWEQKVDTPHFQYYDEDGWCIAYKTDKLKDDTFLKLLSNDINIGINLFCEESNIHCKDNLKIEVSNLQLSLFPKTSVDPLKEIDFL